VLNAAFAGGVAVNPDIKWRIRENHVRALVAEQRVK
jgi:hypothetical protein